MGIEHALLLLVLLPLGAGLAAFLYPSRWLLLLFLGTLVGLAAAFVALTGHLAAHGPLRYALGGWGFPLGIDLYLDGTGLALLGMTALLMAGIGVYARSYFGKGSRAARFWPLLFLTWAALNNLFISGDLFNMYVTLELLGLLSVGMIALAGTPTAYAAALRYLLAALCGSLFYLLGVGMLYSASGKLDWASLRFHLESGPSSAVALGLMTAGLMLKGAVFPLHFWLPPAHANAPAPVSALLSGLMVKAAIYINLRLWLWVFPGTLAVELAAPLLGACGAGAILYGSLQALRQSRLKLLIAYSSVAQLGYLFVFFAIGLLPGATVDALQGVVFFAISHALAKAALFLCSGAVIKAYGHDWIDSLHGLAERMPVVLFAIALGGVSLMGLPPSGGFVGKYLLIRAAIGQGQWLWALVLALGGLLAAAYLFRVLNIALSKPRSREPIRPVPAGLIWPALALALAAVGLGLVAAVPLEIIAVGAPGLESAVPAGGAGP